MSTLAIVLTSAGVASFITGLATIVNQLLERRARRHELLLTKAVELGIHRVEFMTALADKSGAGLELQDPIKLSETYYQWLEHLLEEGELPPEAYPLQHTKRKKPPLPPTPNQLPRADR
jgi:hypothetical protein